MQTMANIKALALSARRKRDNGDALTDADAISKAITGAGITHKGDHARLMRQVGTQFARDKRDAEKSSRRRGAA